jgi:type IV pilus assembly protein PilA
MSRQQKGFTLIELMIVVAIVGVLAVLGVVGYRRIITSSRTAEPKQVIGSIRMAQESYKAETGTYAHIHGTTTPPDAEFCPQRRAVSAYGGKKWGWSPVCPVANMPNPVTPTQQLPFGALPVHVDGPVMFGYATTAGAPNVAVSGAVLNGQAINFPAPTSDWYVVYAVGDTDDNGQLGRAVGSSFSKDIFVQEE